MGRCIALLFAFMAAACAVPSISVGGIGNAASYQTGAVAPGEIVVIFGSDLGPDTLAQSS